MLHYLCEIAFCQQNRNEHLAARQMRHTSHVTRRGLPRSATLIHGVTPAAVRIRSRHPSRQSDTNRPSGWMGWPLSQRSPSGTADHLPVSVHLSSSVGGRRTTGSRRSHRAGHKDGESRNPRGPPISETSRRSRDGCVISEVENPYDT